MSTSTPPSVDITQPRDNFVDTADGNTTLLSPVAYSETALPALQLARSSRLARVIGRILFFLLVVGSIFIIFAPWQQSVKGSGDVMAYDPLEREQTIQSPIKGRLMRIGKDVYENAHVKQGQLLFEIADIDENYLERLQGQLDAAEGQVAAAGLVVEASERNVAAAMTAVNSFTQQLRAYEEIKTEVVAAADFAVESARNKVQAMQQKLAEEQSNLDQVQLDFTRQQTLYQEDIAAQLKYQIAEQKLKAARAKVAEAKANIEAAKNDVSEKLSLRGAKEKKAQADIEYATASLQKATAEAAKAESELGKAKSSLNKLTQEMLKTRTLFERQRNQEIRAPFDGFVTRIYPNQSSQILKEGSPLCVIVPDTADRAVQIWLKGNDAPLVEPGRHVRLQFEGWPAVQFAGWPSVAWGTFGGEVVSVDATSDKNGKFRILVLPDETDHKWPNEKFLRQGVRANGWVLLEEVPLWFEIWRNMNGFPPVVSTEEPKEAMKAPKLPKI